MVATFQPTSAVQLGTITGVLGIDWANPTNALSVPRIPTSSGDPTASISVGGGAPSSWLVFKQTGFVIPTGYDIVGFALRFSAGTHLFGTLVESDLTHLLELGLSKDSGVSITGATKTFDVAGRVAIHSLGAVADLWSGTWTRTEVNSSTFAVVVRRPDISENEARVLNGLSLDVYYTPTGVSLVALERQFSTQKILLGKEVTPGTIVATPLRVMGSNCNASPKGEWKKWSPTGDKIDSIQMLIREWSEAQFDGIPCYDEMGYFLNAGLNVDSPSTIVTGAYQHRWVFNARQANTIQTYTVSYGDPEDATRAHQLGGAFMADFDLDFDRTKADQKAVFIGQQLADGITMTVGGNQVWGVASTATGGTLAYSFQGVRTGPIAFGATTAAVQTALQALASVGAGNMLVTGTAPALIITAAGGLAGRNLPNLELITTLLTGGTSVPTVTTIGGYTEFPLVPILPGQVGIYVASTYAGLAAGKLTRAFLAKVAYKGLRAPVWVLDPANPSFGPTIEPEALLEIDVMVEADSNGMAFLANARAGTQMYLRLLGTGPQIAATGINHSFQLDAAVKISSLPPFSDKDGVYAVEYKFTVDFDTTQGMSTFIQLINGIAAY